MKFSLFAKDLREKLIITLKRFPFAIFYLMLFNFIVLAEINAFNDEWIDETNLFCLWCGSVGTVLSVSLKLFHESCRLKNLYKNIIFGTVQFIHILTSFILAFIIEDKTNIHAIGMAAACVMVLVSIYTLPFFRQKTDLPHWNFIISLCRSGAIALLSGMIMCAGIWVILLSLMHLFDLDISDQIGVSMSALCFLLLSPTIFLAFIPVGDNKFESDVKPTNFNFIVKFAHYLIIPLTGIYIIILYLYALKILFTWNLPNGWVSYLVTISMAGMIFIEFLLYPKIHEKGNKFDQTVLKLLPALILPLLLLMSIGIIRRFYDYGITVARLYLLLFNVWCYAVCIGLILTKSRRISWISISFAAAFALVSIFPLNFSTITRSVLLDEIQSAMHKDHLELPLDQNTYHNWLNQQDKQFASNIVSKVYYINEQFERKDLDTIIDRKADISISYLSYNPENESLPITETYSYYKSGDFYDLIPNTKYRKLKQYTYWEQSSMELGTNQNTNQIVIKIKDIDNPDEMLEFLLPLSQLRNENHDEKKNDEDIILHHPKADLYIHDIRIERRLNAAPNQSDASNSLSPEHFAGILMYKE